MKVYLAAPETQNQHGHAARIRVCQKFSEQAMVDQYTALYRKLSQ
jgi:glycosyltransferase involved in cell wall biosynthesis